MSVIMMAQRLVTKRLSSLTLASLAHHYRYGCCGITPTRTTLLFSSSYTSAWIHSTRLLQEKQPDEDECPAWQNPLHHNNPELEKMFPEDFKEGEEMPLVPLPPLASEGDDSTKVLAPTHIHDLANEILLLNMFEMKQLMDKIAAHFGFDPHTVAMGLQQQPSSGSAAASDSTSDENKVEETLKTSFDLKLIGFDAKSKIKVIKEVRAISGLGLKEAKELVEGAPTIIKKDLKQEEAEEFQKKLQDVGATMEIV